MENPFSPEGNVLETALRERPAEITATKVRFYFESFLCNVMIFVVQLF